MRYYLLYTILICFGSIKAQVINESYFSDTTFGNIDRILNYIEVEDGVLISALEINNTTQFPCIIRLNTNGEVIWSTLNTTQIDYYSCNFFNIEFFSDGFIYGSSYGYATSTIKQIHLWKVDALTGEVVWTNSNYINSRITDIVDYDSTSYLMAYPNGSGQATIGILDKLTGDTLKTKSFEYNSTSNNLAVDANKNIYFSANKILRKFNSNNLDQIIWQFEYTDGNNYLDEINEIYLDSYDNLFLFGTNNASYGQGIGIKIDISTGNQVWNELISNGDVTIADFKDVDGHIYCCHRTTLVGGGTYRYRSSKINKETGFVEWMSVLNHSTLGVPASHSGGNQAALSLDVDCSGDVYLTGYYGDANYGPEAWGIMKVNGMDGSKLFDLTITNDSTTYDDYSVGLKVCVFGDSPVILGYQDDGNNSLYPLYVTIEPNTGEVLQRRRIGSAYQQYSKTIDIKNYDNKTYVLKQVGENVIIEQWNVNQSQDWQKVVSSSGILFANQFSVSDSTIYLTARRQNASISPPYYEDTVSSIQLYKLNRLNGIITDNDSVIFNSKNILPVELESDDNQSFIFYIDSNQLNYFKWSSSIVSPVEFLEFIVPNTMSETKLNIVTNNYVDSLTVISSNQIFSINKNSLLKSSKFTYSSRTTFDHVIIGDTIVMCGKSSLEEQLVSSFNINSGNLNWEYANGLTGKYTQIRTDSFGHIFVAGSLNDKINISKMLQTNGSNEWTNYIDTLIYPKTTAHDLLINVDKNYLSVSGSADHANGSTDALLYFIGFDGTQYDSIIKLDEINYQSVASCMSLLNDSTILVGGSYNRISYSKQGFIYHIDFDECYNLQNIITINSSMLSSLPNMDSYRWLDCDNNYNPIPGETAQNFFPFVNGNYAVEVTSDYCSSISNCVALNNLSNNNIDDLDISFYPNPVSDIIFIKGIDEKFNYKIFNILGELLQQDQNSVTEIQVSNLAKGTYFLHVQLNGKSHILSFSKI